jgi:glycerol kinase
VQGWLLSGAAFGAGLAAGFVGQGQSVLTHPEAQRVIAQPPLHLYTSEESEKKCKHWQEAVSRSVDLADLVK